MTISGLSKPETLSASSAERISAKSVPGELEAGAALVEAVP